MPRPNLTRTLPDRETFAAQDAVLLHVLPQPVLARIEAEAARLDMPAHRVAIAGGGLTPHRYADEASLMLALPRAPYTLEVDGPVGLGHAASGLTIWRGDVDGEPVVVIDVTRAGVADAGAIAGRQSGPVLLVTTDELSAALGRSSVPIEAATLALHYLRPDLSARRLLFGPQIAFGLVALLGVVAAVLMDLGLAVTIASLVSGVVFGALAILRLACLPLALTSPASPEGPPRADGDLATYSVLVPLFDEAAVIVGLIDALGALDYPPAKAEVLLILEHDDAATRRALDAVALPAHMRVVTVPPGSPRTKPRALNYALQQASGDLVVIYDAEDRPEPDQLREAEQRFAASGEDLACLQARLNIYNPRQSLVTRQFALEYSALFDLILPTLVRLGWPLPLGGTSNHFPRRLLIEAGGWDPFNVTEDADLGLRLARLGFSTGMLSSTTWEEAPIEPRQWLGQRTRWLKGWMQTWLVHMRHPGLLMRDLGLWRWIGVQLYLGSLVASALLAPCFIVLLLSDAIAPGWLIARTGAWAQWSWWIAAGNLVAGYFGAIALSALAGARRHRLAFDALLLPAYWLAISIAAYRALLELFRRPSHWEKTRHGLSAAAMPQATSARTQRRTPKS